MTKQVIEACKARAAADYDNFHMFVECYGQEEWVEFVEDMDKQAAFDMMDMVSDHWKENSATGGW